MTAVKEQELPELDDEFALLASEFDTLDELREDVREQLVRAGRLTQAVEARDKALEHLLDTVEVPIPQGLVTAQLEEHFADGHGDDEHRAEVEEQAVRSLKAQLILDEIVKATEVQVSQEELTEYLISRAQQSGMSPQDFADQMVRSGNVNAVVADVARGKALAIMVEKASVSDASGNPVELARLQEDGTLADDVEDEPLAEVAASEVEFADVVDATEVAAEPVEQAAPTANTDKVEE